MGMLWTLETVWHEQFSQEVRQVAFLVEGTGFKTDATRLAAQSQFINDMLFNDSVLGTEGEGTTENPIVLHNCSKKTFAHFLMWFNHTPWETLGISELEGNLDVLHLSHMWLIKDGFDYAVERLNRSNLDAALRLQLARKYQIANWLEPTVRELLKMPLTIMVRDHIQCIGITTFSALACAKEALSDNRRKVSVCLPYPKSFDGEQYCDNQAKCKEVWFTVWIREICRLIHGTNYVPLSSIPDHFRRLPFLGMHAHCRDYVIDYVEQSVLGFAHEERIIQDVIVEISAL